MSKTAREVIAAASRRVEEEDIVNSASDVLEALAAAGFVIVPKEPTDEMTSHSSYVKGEWSRRNYEAIINAVAAQGSTP